MGLFLALLVFAVFWFIGVPVYFAYHFFAWVFKYFQHFDKWLAKWVDREFFKITGRRFFDD